MDKQKLWAVFTAVLGISFVFLLFFSNSRLTDLRLLEERNKSAIAQAKAELEELDAGASAKKDGGTPADGGEKGEEAVPPEGLLELGNTVSDCQNAYASLDAANGGDAFSANVDALDGCFTDSDKGARVPWYTGSLPGTWSFTPDGDRGLWLCRDTETNGLLAYASADYDAGAKQFCNVRYEMTIQANGSVKAEEGSVPEDKVDDINNMADAMKDPDPAPEAAPVENPGDDGADSDAMDIKEAQWRMRQEMMEGGGKDAD